MYQKKSMKYPLSGKIYCSKHRCSFIRKIKYFKNKENVIYWYCGDFHRKGKKDCYPAYFKEEDLYNILLKNFKRFEIYKEEICQELLSYYTSDLKINNLQENQLKTKYNKLKRKKDNLIDLALEGVVTKEELLSKKNLIESQMEKIQKELNEFKLNKTEKPEQKKYNEILKKSIMGELEVNQNNLEFYIEELLNKIIISNKDNNSYKLEIFWG